MTSLGQRSVHAALWGNLGNTARLALQFVAGIVLARLLGPQAFGLVAIALIIIGVGQLVADFGLSSAIIQASELDDRDVDFLYAMQLLGGAALTLGLIVLAGPVAQLFSTPEAQSVIRWMAPLFVLQAIGQTPAALLQRELDFRSLQTGRLAAYGAGYLVLGLPMAFAGYGVWSLVVAQLTQSGLGSLIAWKQTSRKPRPRFAWRDSALLAFGSLSLLANLGSWVIENVGAAMIGYLAGSTSLGIYNRALSLCATPVTALVIGLQTVLLSAASRAQDDRGAVRKAVLACMAFVVLVPGAILLAMAVTARSVIAGIYGTEWMAAASLLAPLGLAMLMHGMLAIVGSALAAIGQVWLESRMQWISVVCTIGLLALGSGLGVEGIAWIMAGAYVLRMVLLGWGLHRYLRFSIAEINAGLASATAVALVSAGSAWSVDALIPANSPLLRLAVIVAAAGSGWCLAAAILLRHLVASPLGDAWAHSGVAASVLSKLREKAGENG